VSPSSRTRSPLEPAVAALESASFLDPPAKKIAKNARDTIPGGPVKDALSGTWLGHALHPLLTDVVIGAFMSATLLDLFGGRDSETASKRLIAIGIAAYGPTAVTGVNDWADTEPADDGVRRVGLVHAAANTVALAMYVGSLRARRRGDLGRGKLLGLGGSAVMGAAGFLGGHLSFAQGVGPDQTVFDPGPTDWTAAVDASALSDGRPTRVVVDETPVLVLRDGAGTFAIHDRCSHRGCSLSEGEVDSGEIVCPCHGSRFDLRDGAVKRGPATAPQPAFQVREREGRIELRRLDPNAAA